MKTDSEKISTHSELCIQAQVVRSEIIYAIHSYFRSKGFLFVNPPVLHEAINNKKSEIYLSINNVNYSLNSSNALFLSVFAAEYGNVYSISSTFRNENESINHLVEFSMLEMESIGMQFDELVAFVVDIIKYILNSLHTNTRVQVFSTISSRIKDLIDNFRPIQRTYTELVNEMCANSISKDVWENDPSEIDLLISKRIDYPTIIVDYPVKFASWTARPKSNSTSYAMNLMLPGSFGELVEGCERIIDSDVFSFKFQKAGITNLNWYIDAVKRINDPRSGFGMGIERLTRWIIGANEISDTLLFYRK